jgi:hypothetical protein
LCCSYADDGEYCDQIWDLKPVHAEVDDEYNFSRRGPIPFVVSDQARIPAVIVRDPDAPKRDELLFELAGPRARLFFDPAKTRL